jgi:signal transduction histidine kinase
VAASAAVARTQAGWSWRLSRSQLLLPLLVAALSQLDVWPSGHANLGHVVGPRPLLASVYVATSLALLWRRRAPLAVLAFITFVDLAYYLIYGAPEGLGSVLPTLIAWYAVGRYLPTRQLLPGAALVVLGIASHELTDPAFRLDGLDVVLWAVVAGGWPIGYAFARRAREVRELANSQEEAARMAVTEERARIARELHDVVGHGISVAVLQLVAALGLLENGATEPARARVLNAERSAREALAEMRRLLGLLDGDEVVAALSPQPGLKQLDKLIDDTRSAGATLNVALEGEPVALPAGLDLAAFRIVQEALTNVLKHASPPSADVTLVHRPDRLDIEVRDHGRNPTTAGRPDGTGRGVAGMRERARIYDGGLHAGPCEDGGYLVRAWLPVAPQ